MSGHNRPTNYDYRPVLHTLLGVLIIAFVLVGLIVVSGAQPDASTTPLITTVLGFASISVLALINMLNGHKAKETGRRTEEKVDKVLNGPMDDKMKMAVRAVLAEREYALDKAAGHNPEPPRHMRTNNAPLPNRDLDSS